MYLLNLAFLFRLYSAASRTGYTICHRPPTSISLFHLFFSHDLCRKVESCKILLLGISPNTYLPQLRILLFPNTSALHSCRFCRHTFLKFCFLGIFCLSGKIADTSNKCTSIMKYQSKDERRCLGIMTNLRYLTYLRNRNVFGDQTLVSPLLDII